MPPGTVASASPPWRGEELVRVDMAGDGLANLTFHTVVLPEDEGRRSNAAGGEAVAVITDAGNDSSDSDAGNAGTACSAGDVGSGGR